MQKLRAPAFIERFVKNYDKALTNNPLRTKLASSFFLGCTGDFLCQGIMRFRYRNDFGTLTDLDLHEWVPSRTFR